MPPGTGLVVNNEMDDFSAAPGDPNEWGLIGFAANEIQPGKRPLSSMSPTFLLGEDKRAVLGTPGGSRIITMVLLGILDFMRGNEPESWVSLPRFHHQYVPDESSAEPDAFTPDQIEALEALIELEDLVADGRVVKGVNFVDLIDAGDPVECAQAYDAMGGIGGALASHANDVLADFSAPAQKLVRSIFQRLVTPESTRAIVDVGELLEIVVHRGA